MTAVATDTASATPSGLLGRHDGGRIHDALAHVRRDAITVRLALPGERREVEVLADGSLEVERFRSDGTIDDATALDELWVWLAADAN